MTQKGSATIEILIAFAIMIIILSGVMAVAFGGQAAGLDLNLTGTGLASTTNFLGDSIASSTTNWSGFTSTSSVGFYTLSRTVTDKTPCLKSFSSGSTWSVTGRPQQNINFETLVVNVPTLLALNGDCTPTKDKWENPVSLKTVSVTPSGNSGTGLDVVSWSGNRYAFLTSAMSSGVKSDFWVIDVTTPSSAALIPSADRDYSDNGLNAITVAKQGAGLYAYVARNEATNQLAVIDISTPSSPALIASSTLPGVGISFPQGRSIFYYKNYLYIATYETAGNEFHIYDVSNPSSPQPKGKLEINHDVFGIAVGEQMVGGVIKKFAYLALSTTNAAAKELMVLDVTDPTDPKTYGSSFNANGTKYATSVFLSGNTLYMGLQKGGASDKDPNFYIFDVTNPSLPVATGTSTLDTVDKNGNTHKFGSGASVNKIVVAGNLAFLATSDSNGEFAVWNISNPKNITQTSPCGIFNYPQSAMDITFFPDYIYIATQSNDALQILKDQGACVP
jgi:hypothetical protein